MCKKGFITISLLLFFTMGSRAQTESVFGIIATMKGTIQISGVWNDSALTAVSQELTVLLDYETAQFKLSLDKSTLRTGVDSLDRKLKALDRGMLVYEGNLGIDFVQTQSHPSQDFQVEGYLTCAPHYKKILGTGHLEHIFGNVYSCVLNMSFHLSTDDIDLDIDLPGLADEIHVEIIQTVLKRETE